MSMYEFPGLNPEVTKDAEEAVTQKFNEVSDRVNSQIKL